MEGIPENISIFSLNLNRPAFYKKLYKAFTWLKENEGDIYMLQETNTVEEHEEKWNKEFGNCYKIWFSHGTDRARGVALMIKKSLSPRVHGIHFDKEGRIIAMDCTIRKLRLTLANFYGPNETTPSYKCLRYLFEEVLNFPNDSEEHKYKNFIIGGDFNVFLDKEKAQSSNTAQKTKSAEYIKKMMNEKNLIDIWITKHRENETYTHYIGEEGIKRIDYFLVSGALEDATTRAEILKKTNVSDHAPINMKMDLLSMKEVVRQHASEELKISCKKHELRFRDERNMDEDSFFHAVKDQLLRFGIDETAEELKTKFKDFTKGELSQTETLKDRSVKIMAEMIRRRIIVVTISPLVDTEASVQEFNKYSSNVQPLLLGRVQGWYYQSLKPDEAEAPEPDLLEIDEEEREDGDNGENGNGNPEE